MAILPGIDYLRVKFELLESTWYKFVSPSIDYASEIWKSYTISVEQNSEQINAFSRDFSEL